MKIPAGYEGAYEKAKKAAGIEPRRRLNMLDDEASMIAAESLIWSEIAMYIPCGADGRVALTGVKEKDGPWKFKFSKC